MTVDRSPLLAALGVDLPDDLLTMALTHRSYSYEHGGLPPTNASNSSATQCSA